MQGPPGGEPSPNDAGVRRVTFPLVLALAILVSAGSAFAGVEMSSAGQKRGPALPPTCQGSTLAIRLVHGGVAAGTAETEFGFVNDAVACPMRGTPRVQMLDASASDLATSRLALQLANPGPPPTVVLVHGPVAYFELAYEDGTGFDGRSCPTSAALRVTPRGRERPCWCPVPPADASDPTAGTPFGRPAAATSRCPPSPPTA